MTYKEYISKSLSKFEVSSDEIELIMVDNGLVGTDIVSPLTAKQAICKSIGEWLPVKSSVSEGGVSISWNLEAIKLYYSSLCVELGIYDISVPKIRDRSNRW